MKISRKKIIMSIVIFIFTIGLIGGAVYLRQHRINTKIRIIQ